MNKMFCLTRLFGVAGILLAVFATSNPALGYYSGPSCSKPMFKPDKPFQFNSQFEVSLYNSEVEYYNMQLRSYTSCINQYLENAKRDMEDIRGKMNEAVSEYNRLPY